MSGPLLRSLIIRLFILATLVFLLVLAVLTVVVPAFPLNIGFVRTTGPAGLLGTLVPALVGGAGLVLMWRGRRSGALLTAAYCAFWGIVFLAGLPQVWNAKQSFCLKGLNFCITSPWVARLTTVAIATPFLLCAWWSARQGTGPSRRKGTAAAALPDRQSA